MASVQPYLTFNGQCEEAVKFYCSVFGGEPQSTMRFKDGPMKEKAPQSWQDKIMHMNFMIRGDQLMASDTMPEDKMTLGNNITLCVSFKKDEKIDDMFKKLAEGGKVSMPLQKTFWDAYFGQLTDKFGINWMFNQEV